MPHPRAWRRLLRGASLLAFAWIPSAWAAPRLTIDATVSADGATITGTLRAEDLDDATWIDPLRDLPVPDNEVDQVRTFPGRVNHGTVLWTTEPDGALRFTTTLPRRRGDVGQVGRGLFANGAWYPQPLVDGRLPTVAWSVTVRLPADTAGALGSTAGRGRLHWDGTAERASLAAIPRGRITTLRTRTAQVTLVTRFRPRRQLTNSLTQLLDLAAIDGLRDGGVAVEAPLPRRLFREGAGLAYVGDRAWRVTPVFRWLHHREGIRALLSAWHDDPDPMVRGIAGSLRSDEVALRGRHQQSRRTPAILRNLRPVADAVLYSREMPYQSEVFDRVVPSDPIRDDLRERFGGSAPPVLLAEQLRDALGDDTADDLGHRLARGQAIVPALEAVGLDAAWLDARRRPYRTQDYVLAVRGDTATVTRVAPADQPPETVVVAVDDDRRRRTPAKRHILHFSEGDGEQAVPLPAGHGRVRLDPQGHVGQLNKVDWKPAPMRFLLQGAISGVNFTEFFLSAFVGVSLRRADDNRNVWHVRLDTNQRVNVGATAAYTRYFGPATRQTRRLHAVTLSTEGAWLSDRFDDNGEADVQLGASVAYTLDTRVSSLFPRRGARLSVGIGAGGIPQGPRLWLRSTTTLVGMVPLHPRVVLASRLGAGIALTDIAQERLSFGGALGIRGIADREIQTNLQAVANFELRFVPAERLGIPIAWLTWLEDLQLSVGLDTGTGIWVNPVRDGDVETEDQKVVGAVGATVGIGAIVHNFGVAPGAINLTIGLPAIRLGFDPPDEDRDLPFELYLTWGVQF